jgi:tetratricopeptide (TPR) repeat protein
MFDITFIQEYWWAGAIALAILLAALAFYGASRSKKRSRVKEISSREMKEERVQGDQLKREMETLRQQVGKLEQELYEKTATVSKEFSEQLNVIDKAIKEKIAEQKTQQPHEDTKKNEWLFDTLHTLFPQIKSLERLEQFKQLAFTRDEVKTLVSDIVKQTRIVPQPVDSQIWNTGVKQLGFFEKGVMTLLAHRIFDIEKKLGAAVGDDSVYLILGNIHYEEGGYLVARDYYDKSLKENPSNPLAFYNLSVVLIQQGHYKEALKASEKTIELDPYNGRAWYNKGIALGRLDRYEEALTALGKALELIPHYARIWHSTGVVLAHLGRHEEALKAYENATELDHDSPDTWYNKGVSLIQLGLHEKALKAYEKTIKMRPDSVDAWYNKGIALARLGRYEEALRAYEKTLDLNPDFADAWYTKACLYAIKGDKPNALADLSKAVMINPACRETAKEDEDFRNLLEDEDFKKIIN